MDCPKRKEEAMNTGRQFPSSFRAVSWFILRADRDTSPTASRLLRKFIGAQSGAGLSDSQDHENGTMAKGVGL